MDEFLKNPNAKWIIPIAAGLIACCCVCLCVWIAGSFFVQDLSGISQAQMQRLLQQGDPRAISALVYGLALCCCPLSIMLLVGGGSFYFVNNYQKNNPPAAPSM